MFTAKNLYVDSQGQEQIATPDTFSYRLRSHNSTKTSSIGHSLPNEESRERQFDIIDKQGEKTGNRLATQDNNTEGNDQEKKDILDSDSSDSTNLPSFRCILNEKDPDLNNPNLYNCKTCRKGLIFIRSRTRRLSEEKNSASNAIEEDCEDLSFENNQLSGDLVTNPDNHERHHLKTQRDSLAANTAPTIFSTVKHLTSDSTSVEFDDQHKSNVYHLRVCLPKISFEESKNVQADEIESRLVCSALEEGFKNQLTGTRRTITNKTKIKTKRLFKCKKCPRWFTSKQNLKSHNILFHGAQGNFTCEFFQKGFTNKSQFESHSRIHKTDVEAKRLFECGKCSKRFTSKQNFERHTLVHGAQAEFICASCSKGFMRRWHLKQHLKVHGFNVDPKIPFKCDNCPKQYFDKRSIEQHMLLHGAQAQFTCKICHKGFINKCLLKRHSKVHKAHAFKCNKCLGSFSTKQILEKHTLIHGAQGKFTCELCQKGFMCKSQFEVHSRIHKTDVEAKFPFKCNKCSKRFTLKGSCKKHMTIHEARDKFICDFCSKGFWQKCHLGNHLKIHENKIDAFPFKYDKVSQTSF